MDTENIKEKAKELELDISNLIKKFEVVAGVSVTSINLRRLEVPGRIKTELSSVEVKVDLW